MPVPTKKIRKLDLSCDRRTSKEIREHSRKATALVGPCRMRKVQMKEEGRKFIPDSTQVLEHFIQWDVMLKRGKILFCSPQGMESRPGRSSSRERGFCSKGRRTNNRGWPRTGGARQTKRQIASFRAGRPLGTGTAETVI